MEIPRSRDLRAASTTSKRARTRAEKYYHFRYIKAGQLHQPHYRLLDPNNHPFTPDSGLFLSQNTHENMTPIEYFTPRRLYKEAQCWPRPPTYHRRHKDKLDKKGAVSAYESRTVAQRDTGRMLRAISGPTVVWEHDEPERSCGKFGGDCTLCAHLPECVDESMIDYDEARMDEILAAHEQCAARSLLDDASERWVSEQERKSDMEEWSILSSSYEDLWSESGTEVEHSDLGFQWTFIN
ncbi:MAG: hypothetical protein Q9208_008336 [Pyrenodesmia sp. 3 TL-2023]